MNKETSICVLVTTYNHEKYIAQCLDSILAQDYAGGLKIIIGEDCSKDGTANILREYQLRYPDQVFPIFRPTNIGGHANFLATLDACKTKWIAWLEGDDFWTDPSKISKQVSLLVEDPDAVICFSKAKSLDITNLGFAKNKVFEPDHIKHMYTRQDLLRRNIIPTCTAIFSKEAVWPLPDWYTRWHLGDWTLYLEALKKGHAIFLNEVTASYRIHAGGVWSHVSASIKLERQESLIKFLMENESDSKSQKTLLFNLFSQQLGLTVIYLSEASFKKGFKKLKEALISAVKAEWSLYVMKSYFKKAIQLFSYLLNKKKAR